MAPTAADSGQVAGGRVAKQVRKRARRAGAIPGDNGRLGQEGVPAREPASSRNSTRLAGSRDNLPGVASSTVKTDPAGPGWTRMEDPSLSPGTPGAGGGQAGQSSNLSSSPEETKRPYQSSNVTSSGQQCHRCTFLNTSGAQECAICGAELRHGRRTRWSCGRCTMQNPASSVQCSACQHPRPLVLKVGPSVIDIDDGPVESNSATGGATSCLAMKGTEDSDPELPRRTVTGTVIDLTKH